MAAKQKQKKTRQTSSRKPPAKARGRKTVAAPENLIATPDARYIDRDESWLLFNRRVLEEADDPTNPLLERVKFLAITSSNLDEFIEIRVAGVLQRLEENRDLPQLTDDGGLTHEQRLDRLRSLLHQFAHDQAETWNAKLAPALAKAGIRILQWKDLRTLDRAFAAKYFKSK